MTLLLKPALLSAAVLLAACSLSPEPAKTPAATALAEPGTIRKAMPADAFLAALASHCGQAFAGRILSNQPKPTTPDAFEGKALVMHVRGCEEPAKGLRVPFHVGDDHSRTWVLTRTDHGLRLKHDHRHEDGSEDVLTQYGGDSTTPGTAKRQEFPVDAESIALFEREGSNASVTNTWAMEVDPNQRFLYELSRPNGRLFQVEFDLSKPVALPPAPWGATD